MFTLDRMIANTTASQQQQQQLTTDEDDVDNGLSMSLFAERERIRIRAKDR